MTMADKIVVLSAGHIEQVGSPLELYHRPRNLFVAGFIGSPKMNFLTVAARPAPGGAEVTLPGGAVVTLAGQIAAAGQMTLGLRPEHASATGVGDAVLEGTVKLAEHLGSETLFFVALADGSEIAVKADGLAPERPGDRMRVGVPARACHLFDAGGQALVNGDLTR
jgi:multiple sugar transport system ATP-binding protein